MDCHFESRDTSNERTDMTAQGIRCSILPEKAGAFEQACQKAEPMSECRQGDQMLLKSLKKCVFALCFGSVLLYGADAQGTTVTTDLNDTNALTLRDTGWRIRYDDAQVQNVAWSADGKRAPLCRLAAAK